MAKKDIAVKTSIENLEQQLWLDPTLFHYIYNALYEMYEAGYNDRIEEEKAQFKPIVNEQQD
jgi:hypothetical protein